MRARTLAALALVGAALTAASAARADAQMAVIAHRDAPIENLRLADLRDLFLGRPTRASAPAVIFENRDLRERFYRSAMSMSVREVKQRWIQVVLAGGRTQPPVEVDGADIVSRVAATSGAVGFVDPPPPAGSVRIVRIDGLLPGEQGYPLP